MHVRVTNGRRWKGLNLQKLTRSETVSVLTLWEGLNMKFSLEKSEHK